MLVSVTHHDFKPSGTAEDYTVQQETKTNTIERLTASVSEAAQMLGVSERMIYKLTKDGRLPCKKIGTRVLYPIDGLRRFVNEPDPIESNN